MRCFLIIFKCFSAISIFRNNPFFSLLLSSTPLLLSFPSFPYLFLLPCIPFMNCDVFAPCIKSVLCFPSSVLLTRPVMFSIHSIHLHLLSSALYFSIQVHTSFSVHAASVTRQKNFWKKVLKIQSFRLGWTLTDFTIFGCLFVKKIKTKFMLVSMESINKIVPKTAMKCSPWRKWTNEQWWANTLT